MREGVVLNPSGQERENSAFRFTRTIILENSVMTRTTCKRKVLNLFSIFILIVLMACFAPGCGGGGGEDPVNTNPGGTDPDPDPVENAKPVAVAGPDQTVVVDSDVDLDGRQSSDADGDSLTYKWSLEKPTGSSVTLSDDSAAQFTFTPDAAGDYVIQLVVYDGTENSDPDSVTVTVDGPAIIGDADPSILENLLYTVYSGIGYNRLSFIFDDDEFLYRLMFNDLNLIAADLTYQTIMNDEDMVTNLLEFIFGQGDSTIDFNTSFEGGTSSVSIQRGETVNLPGGGLGSSVRNFSASLSIDITTDGYLPTTIDIGDARLYGETGKFDLQGTVEGYISLTPIRFFLRSVNFTAGDTLSITYGQGVDAVEVTYDEWTIEYELKYGNQDPNYETDYDASLINIVIVPVMYGIDPWPEGVEPESYDNREYSLNGGFSVAGQAYEFFDVRYKQTADGIGNAGININGRISVPDLDGFVEVKESIGSDYASFRNKSGIWYSGAINLSGLDANYDVKFSYNGDDPFSSPIIPVAEFSKDDSAIFSVVDWQDVLDPYDLP